VTGFGDGAYRGITLGFGNLQDVRDVAGINGALTRARRRTSSGTLLERLTVLELSLDRLLRSHLLPVVGPIATGI
jgi:hypothetical protein